MSEVKLFRFNSGEEVLAKVLDNMTIPFKAVAFVVTPKTALVNEYSSSFGSGLVTPDREVEAPQLKLVME